MAENSLALQYAAALVYSVKVHYPEKQVAFKHYNLSIIRVSTPAKLCSTTTGQALLGWYFTVENHYCCATANDSLLPRTRISEN